MNTQTLIERLTSTHSGRYTYSIPTETVTTNDTIVCTCVTHGAFLTKVHDHLYHKSNCPLCSNANKSKSLVDFIHGSTKVHGGLYDYSRVDYVNSYTPVHILCPSHGMFSQEPSSHLRGCGCPKCAVDNRTMESTTFIDRARVIHNNAYNYINIDYINSKTKVTIVCPIHGEFTQTPDNHLRGHGCPQCAGDGRRGAYVANHSQTSRVTGKLYVARFEDNDETFFKIGITVQKSVHYRYGKIHNGYNVTDVVTVDLPIGVANQIERRLLNELAEFKHRPIRKFGGYTECVSAPIETIKRSIHDLVKGVGHESSISFNM